MNIAPINVAKISQGVSDVLTTFPALSEVTITRGEDPIITADICPWIGIYRMSVEYPQRLIVGAAGYRGQQVRMMILVTEADAGSGQACEESLEKLVVAVLSALMSDDTKLGGVVQMLDSFAVDYTRYTRNGQSYVQTAAIQFVALTNTTIGG